MQQDQNSNKGHKLAQTFIFHEDPGHGWLEVPYADLVTLGIADKISGFSYRNGTKVYLEEDCDAPLYIEAYCKICNLHGGYAEFRQRITDRYAENIFIRNLDHYQYK